MATEIIIPQQLHTMSLSHKIEFLVQVGRVVEGTAEFYSGRLTKKERKQTFADELLSSTQLKAYRYAIPIIGVGPGLECFYYVLPLSSVLCGKAWRKQLLYGGFLFN